jgi:hypothetical protein
MIKHLLTSAGLALSLFAAAQINHGGQPSNWAIKTASTGIQYERMGAIDRERLALEDAIKQNLAKQEKCRGHDERRRALELELDQLRAMRRGEGDKH